MRIGILEDDVHLQEMYKLWFASTEQSCKCYGTSKDFLQALPAENFDILLLDWMLPDSSGEIALKWIRENIGWHIPVIFVTARDAEADIVGVLRAGADDYVVKPPKFPELLARIESVRRRINPPKIVQIGAYEINQELRRIRLNGKEVELTKMEFDLSCYLFQNPGKLLSRVHLLEKLWGLDAEVDTRTVDTHVSRVRRKLKITPENGWQIIPVYGYGYRIERVAAV